VKLRKTIVPARLIRIVIVDDHPIVRNGLRNIVEAEPDLTVVAEAATAEELRSAPALADCDVVVLDLAIPGAVGLSVLKELRARCAALPILMLSITPEEQFAMRALRAGASGYLTKRSAPDQLVDAIRRVAAGGIYVSVAMSRVLASEALRPPARRRSGHNQLSDRELEVLRLLASGLSPTRIGAQLSVSIKTISTYRKRLLTKLGLDSNAGLIRYAIEERLIEP
jgi:two-component system invasion response regulator UvrY